MSRTLQRSCSIEPSTMRAGVRRARSAHRAFTIIELIVVILIITIVSAILLPALGAARNVAKRTATQSMMNDLVSASTRFEQDKRRLPGYFTPAEMGSTNNWNGTRGRGMSGMENVLLDLAGGIVNDTTSGGGGGGGGGGNPGGAPEPISADNQLIKRVGPLQDVNTQVTVDLQLIGVAAGGFAPYFVPPKDLYKPQFNEPNRMGQNSSQPHSGGPNLGNQLPDLLDHFGTPILVWSQDDGAVGRVGQLTDFARENYQAGASGTARFYYASNSAFLTATYVGKKGVNMRNESLLGNGSNERLRTLAALLGNPAYPTDRSEPFGQIFPTASRGRIVFHSAGTDGTYLGKKENGARQFSDGNALDYGLAFKDRSNQPYTDDNGSPTTVNLFESFDDVIVTGGN